MNTRHLPIWVFLCAAVSALSPTDAPAAVHVGDHPTVRRSLRAKVFAPKRKRPRKPKRGGIVTPLGTPCSGTSVITATDEIGNPIFPRSVTPVTTQSFVFTNSVRPLLQAPQSALRILALDQDPPMVTVAPMFVGNLVLSTDAFSVLGTGSLGGDAGIIRCNIPANPNCTIVHSLAGRMSSGGLSRLSDDALLVGGRTPNGRDIVFVVTDDGDESPLYDVADAPAGFMARATARVGNTVYVAGYTLPDLRALVVAVPLDGGPLREEITFDPDLYPGALTGFGGELVVEVEAHVVQSPSRVADARPSRLLRVSLDAAGAATEAVDLPIDAPGFVNVTDLESLAGQLFAVDSRLPTSGEWTYPDGTQISGRMLRICP